MTDDPLALVDWGRLHDAYGPASAVPGRLRALRDDDRDVRSTALSQLFGSVCHQGTRWQVSHAVVPFLVALVDDATTPDRATVLDLLTAVAIGNRRDLPFDPDRAFARANRAATGDLIPRFYAGEELTGDETEVLEAEAVRWAADSYHRTAEHLTTIAGWVGDADDEVAARAAALVAWFAPTAAAVSALVAVPAGRHQPRASANLALAHVPATDARIGPRLDELTGSTVPAVAVTAAVAAAHRDGPSITDRALSILVDAAERERVDDVVGWNRALRGFVMIALRRLGLG